MHKAVSIILNLEITPEVLKRFGTCEENLRDLRELEPKTWVDLVVLHVLGKRTSWEADSERPSISIELSRAKLLHT